MKYIALLVSVLFSSSAFANWSLENSESTLSFVSTKKSAVGEVHHFKSINGTVSEKGEIAIEIDLSSVETGIGIRNDRMKAMLFNVAKFAKAHVTANVDKQKLDALAVGEAYVDTVAFTVSLHGLSQYLTSKIKVVKLKEGKILASSVQPIVINAGQFGLDAGIEKLREVAGLPSISTAVPVMFDLAFKR
ncbi:MAG: YceI family protein [Cellvibrionaceae bacterium]